MAKKGRVDIIEAYLRQKREELIWALSLQDFTFSQIARMFGLNRSTVLRIIRKKPRDWSPKWVKQQDYGQRQEA